ncbi:glycosyltransferase family 25 protein [Nitratireductor sp. B36]|nr:glycosyltransferase family 25 protein [Nitratireductor sp. B36]
MKFMKEQLVRQHVDFERIRAVDGRKLDMHQYQNACITPGEIGCFLSHRIAWRTLCNSSDAFALVLEDDVHLSDDFAHFAKHAAWIPDDVAFITLETTHQLIDVSRKSKPATGGRILQRIIKNGTCLGGYIIRRDFAEYLLSDEGFSMPVDDWVFLQRTMNAHSLYQLNPAIVIQNRAYEGPSQSVLKSTIAGERMRRVWPQQSFWKRLNRMLSKPVEQNIKKLVDLLMRRETVKRKIGFH